MHHEIFICMRSCVCIYATVCVCAMGCRQTLETKVTKNWTNKNKSTLRHFTSLKRSFTTMWWINLAFDIYCVRIQCILLDLNHFPCLDSASPRSFIEPLVWHENRRFEILTLAAAIAFMFAQQKKSWRCVDFFTGTLYDNSHCRRSHNDSDVDSICSASTFQTICIYLNFSNRTLYCVFDKEIYPSHFSMA